MCPTIHLTSSFLIMPTTQKHFLQSKSFCTDEKSNQLRASLSFPLGDTRPNTISHLNTFLFSPKGLLTAENSTATPHSSSLPTGDAAFLAVVAALGLLAAITAGLLLHLCFFHIYISFLGLTTYEYIRQQRQTQNQTPSQSPQPNEEDSNYRCPTLRHRPANLHCDGRTRTTLVTCTVLEETFSNCAEPTPTPPTTPQDCQVCVSNSVGPEASLPQPKKLRTKWNCCLAVPDSPDSPNEPRCLMNICKHKMKKKGIPAIEGRPHRTHGHWSSAKLRVLFRVLGGSLAPPPVRVI